MQAEKEMAELRAAVAQHQRRDAEATVAEQRLRMERAALQVEVERLQGSNRELEAHVSLCAPSSLLMPAEPHFIPDDDA